MSEWGYWEPDHADTRDVEARWQQADNQEAREQEQIDRLRERVGFPAAAPAAPKVCSACGRRYWNAGAHAEECTGRRSAA